MHDLPYTVCPGPEVTAAMTVISAAVRKTCPDLTLGVQILCAANQQAIAVALAAGLDFIRAEGFVFSHVADEGIINACAGGLLRYRKQVGAENIQVFADIKKKHSAHALTADVSVAETAAAAELFLADGVVLTGTATGLPADPRELKEVQHAVKIPVLIGSGVTLENGREGKRREEKGREEKRREEKRREEKRREEKRREEKRREEKRREEKRREEKRRESRFQKNCEKDI
ncbi:uncharacterized protein F13E9.13, mitochondrial-like isoform X3 [Pogoniulus pusillus]|uniref:uncharacterized protein F13E9.13, mitochondrial-like isoform X3 n=1 Tax=Pogoniulus pusillus TaxID=488313 RepID=UPI0030B9A3F7